MILAAFVWAVLALLVAPGPTNTLMGLAGAVHGLRTVVSATLLAGTVGA